MLTDIRVPTTCNVIHYNNNKHVVFSSSHFKFYSNKSYKQKLNNSLQLIIYASNHFMSMKINFPELCFSLPVLWHCDTPVVMLSYNFTTSSLLEHAVGRLKKSLIQETYITDQNYLDKLVKPSFLQSFAILSLENSFS